MSENDHSYIETGPSEVLASLPALVGFTPSESIVLIGLDGGTPPVIECTSRIDRGSENLVDEFSAALRPLVKFGEVKRVILVLIGHTQDPTSAAIEAAAATVCFTKAAQQLPAACNGNSVELLGTFSVPEIVEGARWVGWHSGQTGLLPDPRSTELASAEVFAGKRTFGSREELEAHLQAPDDAPTRHRGQLLREPFTGERSQLVDVLNEAIAQAQEGRFEPDDETVVMLRHALDDQGASRDLWRQLRLDHTGPISTVATVLARSLPTPYSAYPKTLVGLCAYLDRNGPLCHVALRQAIAEDPNDDLTKELIRGSVNGVPPETLRTALDRME